jgi:hypothetical protein
MVIAALPYRAAALEGAILTGRAATHRGSGKRAAIFGSGATVVEAALLPAAQVCLRVATRQPRRTTELGLVRGVAGVLPWRAALAGCTGLRKILTAIDVARKTPGAILYAGSRFVEVTRKAANEGRSRAYPERTERREFLRYRHLSVSRSRSSIVMATRLIQ